MTEEVPKRVELSVKIYSHNSKYNGSILKDEGGGPFVDGYFGGTDPLGDMYKDMNPKEFQRMIDSIIAGREIMNELTGSHTLPTVVWAVEVYLDGYEFKETVQAKLGKSMHPK
jgi:hypothetical protein